MPILNKDDNPDKDPITGATTNVAKVGAAIAAIIGVLAPVVAKAFGDVTPDNRGSFYIATAIVLAASLFTVALIFWADVTSRAKTSAAKLGAQESNDPSSNNTNGNQRRNEARTEFASPIPIYPTRVSLLLSGQSYTATALRTGVSSDKLEYLVHADGKRPKWIDLDDIHACHEEPAAELGRLVRLLEECAAGSNTREAIRMRGTAPAAGRAAQRSGSHRLWFFRAA